MDATRALLDELMGKERNVPLSERSGRKVSWDDPAVCQYQLAGLCPHRLFKNTRSDLGPCPYEFHDDHLEWEAIKEDYEKESDRDKERYEKKLLRYMEDLIRDMDRKIKQNRERAERESAPRELKPEDQARLNELQQRARESLDKSQRLGETGDVDASMLAAQQADTYKKQYDDLLKRLTTPDRTMTVCEICGLFINSSDNDQRRLDHLTGKQYLGWKAIRDHYAVLSTKWSGSLRGGSVGPERARSPAARSVSREHRSSTGRDEHREHRSSSRDHAREDYRSSSGRDRERDYRSDPRGSGSHRDRERSRERDRYRDDRRDDRGGDRGGDYRRDDRGSGYGRDRHEDRRRY